jgi:hypothetical protein
MNETVLRRVFVKKTNMHHPRIETIAFALLLTVAGSSFGLGHGPDQVDAKRNSGQLKPISMADPAVDSLINWPTYFGVQQTGKIEAAFNCFGQFGIRYSPFLGDVSEWPDASFVTPAGSGAEYLYGGGIWIGGILGDDTLVSTGIRGLQAGTELYPPGYSGLRRRGSVTRFDYSSDYAMRAHFTDTINSGVTYQQDIFGSPHQPLNVRIANRSHIWRQETCASLVVYDLVVTNIGSDEINRGYIGLYFDADIGFRTGQSHSDDVAGSIRKSGVGYMVDTDGDPVNGEFLENASATRILAAQFLKTSFNATDTSFNWWENGVGGSFGPRRIQDYRDFLTGNDGAPQADGNAYHMMSSGEWDYNQVMVGSIGLDDPVWRQPDPNLARAIRNGSDSRFLLSIGPFDLLPDSSVRVLFTTATTDSIITRTDLLQFIDLVPELYDDVLNLEYLNNTLALCDTLVDLLLDPNNPVVGLQVAYLDDDSVVVEWDPWVFDNVDGFDVFQSEILHDALPYPGVIPPWLRLDNPQQVASLARTYRYTLEKLDRNKLYLVGVSHRSGGLVGDPGKPVVIQPIDRAEAPSVAARYAFVGEQEPALLQWEAPANVEIDHFNVYRFPDSVAASMKYHPFYDNGYRKKNLIPTDSFFVDNRTWYYYALEPLQTTEPDMMTLIDSTWQGRMVYHITAVDIYGFESEFSEPIIIEQIAQRNRDILVLTYSTSSLSNNVHYDSLVSFYSDILSDYDYEIYNVRDTTRIPNCSNTPGHCVDWNHFIPFRLVIVDDGTNDLIMNIWYENATAGFARYLTSGGRLAYFGPLSGFDFFVMNTEPAFYPVTHPFVREFFGIDSLFHIGGGYYALTSQEPYVDSLAGFHWAKSESDEIPDLLYDSTANHMVGDLNILWPHNTPPSVAAFKTKDGATITHRYRSISPESSMVEGEAVGVKTSLRGTETYAFGFHLWYMDRPGARQLVDWIMERVPTDISDDPPTVLPNNVVLHSNYPNPFNPSTTISFELPRHDHVTLDVFNVLGQRVKTLLDVTLPAGSHQIEWDGRDSRGYPVASGLYLYRLKAGSTFQSRKMLLLK